jgi:hypothetical protein
MQLCADAIIVCLPDSFYMPHFERKATVGIPVKDKQNCFRFSKVPRSGHMQLS